MPEPVIVIDESNTPGAGEGQPRRHRPRLADGDRRRDQLRHPGHRRRDRRPRPRNAVPAGRQVAMDTMSGLWTPARENLDVTTVNEQQRRRRHCAHRAATGRGRIRPRPHGARSPSFVASHTGFRQLAKDIGAGARRVHATDEPADARRGAVIEPGPAPKLTRWRAHRCASHLGRPPARWGTPARGRGDPPPKGRELPPAGSGATPTRVPSGYTQPRAGAAGDRIRLGRRRATTGGQSRHLGAQPGAHPVTGMRVKPAPRSPRPKPPDPATSRR